MRRQPVDRVPVTLYEFNRYGKCWAAREPSYRPLLDLQDQYGDTCAFVSTGSGILGEGNTDGKKTDYFTPRGPLTVVSRRDAGVATTWKIKAAIETDEDIEKFLSIDPVFRPPDAKQILDLEKRLGSRGIVIFGTGDPLGNLVGLFDFEKFVLTAYQDFGLIKEMLTRVDILIRAKILFITEHFSDAAVRFWGPEYSGAPLMDPHRFFEPLVLAFVKPLVDLVHQGNNIAIIHCHGRLKDILDMIRDTGADVLEPLELPPMPTADVKLGDLIEKLGSDMCLAGGMQARDMDTGTPDRIRQQVRELKARADEASIIILPTSTPLGTPLPDNVLANYRAMFEEAREG